MDSVATDSTGKFAFRTFNFIGIAPGGVKQSLSVSHSNYQAFVIPYKPLKKLGLRRGNFVEKINIKLQMTKK